MTLRSRTRIIGAVPLLLVLAFVVIISWSQTDPNAPRYVPLHDQPVGPFGVIHYNWNVPAPFVDNKVWIFTILNPTNHQEFLFDLEKRKVLGELFKGAAVFSNQEHTKILCQGEVSLNTSIKDKLSNLLSRVSSRRINIFTNRTEAYWILNLQNNSARRIGILSQWPGTGSTWIPAPGFRFGFNVPNNDEDGVAFFVCDLEQESFRKIRFIGQLRGWWDERRILIKKPTGEWVLYDVLNEDASTLLGLETISRRLRELGITDDPASLSTCSFWNGTNYEFRLVAKQGWNWYTNGTFIFKIDRSGALTLSRKKFVLNGKVNLTQPKRTTSMTANPVKSAGVATAESTSLTCVTARPTPWFHQTTNANTRSRDFTATRSSTFAIIRYGPPNATARKTFGYFRLLKNNAELLRCI